MTSRREAMGIAGTRVREFVERYAVWMKDVSTAAQKDSAVAACLIDLMKSRLASEIDHFVEAELRLRAFERRAPEQQMLFKRVGNDG